jgi:dethiobiotin synthetase
MPAYFITGTDTDVGKTIVATALLKYFNSKGMSTIGFKPIAAGCESTEQGLRNSDALSLQQNSSLNLPYETVNPFAFEPPIAPHIAAKLVGEKVSIDGLSTAFNTIKSQNCDVTVVEGAGGWYLPINDSEFLYQWVMQEKLTVILVVGIKLGCLNHALLSQSVILAQGLTIAGWVANVVSPQARYIDENIATLKQHLSSPLLATIPFVEAQQFTELQVDFNF